MGGGFLERPTEPCILLISDARSLYRTHLIKGDVSNDKGN